VIGTAELLALARALDVVQAPKPAAVKQTIAGLRSRRVPSQGPAPRLRYPGKPEGLAALARALDAARKRDPAEFAMLADVLRDPQRGYPAISDDPSVRTTVLLGSWSFSDRSVMVGFAWVTESLGPGPAKPVAVRFEILDSTSENLVERFEKLFIEIQPAARNGDRHRDRTQALLWVGDSGRAGASGGGWKTEIAAISEARGLTLECCAQPTAFQAAQTQLARFAGDAVAVWTPAAGPFATPNALPLRWRDRAIYLQESDFEESLEELRLSLDDQTPEQNPPVESWDEFDERADGLEHAGIVLTENCRGIIRGNAYPDPARMWVFTLRLSQAADAWRELGGQVGDRLSDWIAANFEIEVAMHDSTLGSWTDFTFEGDPYSREPHVKVDDFKNPRECGRIYFAVDSERLRFIVDYIGLHP
jgi:hypothetical protein